MADMLLEIANGATKRFIDQGDGTVAEAMTLVGFAGDVTITGDANIDTTALEAIATSQSTTPGDDGATISLASVDFTTFSDVKGVVVCAAGNVILRPLNAGADITLTAVPAGFIIPWNLTAIRKTGTTATLATIK